MKKLIIALTLFVALGIGMIILVSRVRTSPPQNSSSAPLDPSHRKLLIIGEEWPPFEFVRDGEIVGIDVEILGRILGQLGIDYEFKIYPWSRCKLMAENGETDLLVSISYAQDRESFLQYTDSQREYGRTGIWPDEYLWRSEYVFFCRKLNADKFRFESYAQIKADGYRIGIVQDYCYNPEFWQTGLDTIMAPDFPTGMQLLSEGKCDLFPGDKTIGLAAIKEYRLDKELTFIPGTLFSKPYLIPACKKSTYPGKERLMKQIYNALAVMRASGEYQTIYAKYVKQGAACP